MRMKVEGMEDALKAFDSLSVAAQRRILKKVLYPGAGVMADAMKAAVESLPTATASEDIKNLGKGRKSHLRQYEKDGLLAGLGITPMRTFKDGWNVSVGFHGYNERGKANAMIARSLDAGTSFMPADKTISRAQSRAKKQVVEAMREQLNEEIDETMKGV